MRQTFVYLCQAAFCAALLAVAAPQPGVAGGHGAKEPGLEQVGTQFRRACMDTYPSFEGFDDVVADYGFYPLGDGTLADGINNTIFQLWDGPQHLTCTVFYIIDGPDIEAVTRQVSMTALRGSRVQNLPYDAGAQRSTLVLDAFSRGIFEHRVMSSQGGRVAFRMILAVPKEQ